MRSATTSRSRPSDVGSTMTLQCSSPTTAWCTGRAASAPSPRSKGRSVSHERARHRRRACRAPRCARARPRRRVRPTRRPCRPRSSRDAAQAGHPRCRARWHAACGVGVMCAILPRRPGVSCTPSVRADALDAAWPTDMVAGSRRQPTLPCSTTPCHARRPRPRRLHHGRQRSMGQATRAAAHRRPHRGRGEPGRAGPCGRAPQRRLAHRVRLLHRELGAPPWRGPPHPRVCTASCSAGSTS